MTHVHYKFSSKLSYDTVVFDGLHVTLRDLKRQIMGREKLRAGDCDLQITNAQNKEEFTDEDGSIPKGSSVIVRRIPIIGGKSNSSKIRNVERSDTQTNSAFGAFKAMDDPNSSRALPFFTKMANLADVEGTEEDKIRVMMNQSAYDSMSYNKKPCTVLPANYTCYRCGGSGHHIRNCPSTGDKNQEAPVKIKKSSGIPRSFMVEVDDPSVKGAMLTSCGRYAVPTIDAQAYAIGKKERPPFVPRDRPESVDEEDPVPEELLCLICLDLMSDAVVIPCCGNSYCDDCIRSALLDSDDHVCPTCSQSDVSPDNLIANKFLRQAVDNFKKERGFTKNLKKGCSASQSQNPTPNLSPALTPPPLSVQIQPQKPLLLNHRQQDPLRQHSQAADTPPSSQVPTSPASGPNMPSSPPPLTVQIQPQKPFLLNHRQQDPLRQQAKTADTPPSSQVPTSPASAPNTPSSSCQPVQSHLETTDKEAEEKTDDDSAAVVATSAPVSSEEHTDAPSQLIPLVNLEPEVEQPQTDCVNQQQPSPDPPPRPSGPSKCWESSSSSSGCPPGGWTEPNAQQRPPCSSPYPATPPPLFPPPHFHTFLTAPPPLTPYPPGYPPAVWTIPNLPGAPIAPLCPSSSIPALVPKEWYMQRKKERSPHRGSSHRRSSSGSHSKSSKSKASRSYSRSSSRSRSRSRSQGRSRPHSSYSHHRDPHPRSTSSRSYSYGYKRSPTPSSSSSPKVGYRSRSRSPPDHRRNSHQSRHQSRKSSSGNYDSRRRGERPPREAGGYTYDPHANQSGGMDQERYLQLKREYKEWCDKYFSSYVGHFQQMPIPLLSLPHPPPPPQWGDREGSKNYSHANSDSRIRVQGRRSTRMEKRSPPSSSDSRSPPSRSSRDSRSTPSQTSSDSRSSPFHSSNDSGSPPSQSSSSGRSTPSEDRAQLKTYERRRTEKNSRLPTTPLKGSEEPQEKSKDKKQLLNKNLEKHKLKRGKKHEEVEESSSPDSKDDCRKGKRDHKTGPNNFKDGSPAPKKGTANNAFKSVKQLVKPEKRSDKDYERKSREQRSLEKGKERRRGEHSDSRKDVGRRHRGKPSHQSGRVEKDRYRHPEGKRASELDNIKRKRGNTERDSVKTQSTKCLKDPQTRKSESPIPFERNKPKTEKKWERKTWPLAEGVIWEGGIQMKPQKKISININLEGKKNEEKSENLEFFESIAGKTKTNIQAGNGEERLNRGETDIEAKKETSEDMEEVSEEKIKPDEETKQKWEKATFRDDGAFEKKVETEKEDFDVWHSFCREMEEEKESEKKPDEGDMMEASKGEGVTNEERELDANTSEEMLEEESTFKKNIGNLPGESKSKDELMELLKWRMMGEQEESHHDRPNTVVDDDSSYEDHQEMKTVLKTLEELSQDTAADLEDELVLKQVPQSKWDKKESEENQQGEGAIKVQTDPPAVYRPSPSVSVTTETPVEIDRRNEKEKTPNLSVVPSSGKDRTDREEEKRIEREMERQRDRERGRESDKSRDRQKDRKRSKERRREGEKERERERERSHKRNPPSSSHSYSYSTSHDTERKDKFSKKVPELPDQNVHKRYRDTSLDSTFKDPPHFYNNHQEKGEREMEERERPSSNSTSLSASQENGQDDARKEKRKQKKPEKEKRQASPEPGEEEELKTQIGKTSKQSRDGEEEESSGDFDKTMLMLSLLS
ncbi:E3 ubiquitin-protein ligase RBBP6-like isoform X2 [Eleginops maclovinus]